MLPGTCQMSPRVFTLMRRLYAGDHVTLLSASRVLKGVGGLVRVTRSLQDFQASEQHSQIRCQTLDFYRARHTRHHVAPHGQACACRYTQYWWPGSTSTAMCLHILAHACMHA